MKENKTIFTDFYEITMSESYFDQNLQEKIVVFDVFFRKNIFDGGYTIMGGLDEIIDYIQNFRITDEEIYYLKSLGQFSEKHLDYLKRMKFTGDIYAIPDGTPVFPNEPVMTIKAPANQAQFIETALLVNFNHASLVTTATKRIVNAADGRPVMEFGARRARGLDSATEVSKYAIIGGCVATSNTYAGMKYGLPVSGTMAHSYMEMFPTEYDAFLAYAKTFPNNAVFLVDTYNVLKSGIPNAIKVAKEYLVPNGYRLKGIRIDSGDLAYLSKEARKMLDEAGLTDCKICLSNGLNEYTLKSLLEQGACIDSLGIGDNIAASKERLGGVYKLVSIMENGSYIPKIKVSEDPIKTINPAYKKAYRFYDKETGFALGDVIALHDEIIDKNEYTLINPIHNEKTKTIKNYTVRELQVPIFVRGKLVYNQLSIMERQAYCTKEFESLYPEITRLMNPHEYYVDLSENLLTLKKKMVLERR